MLLATAGTRMNVAEIKDERLQRWGGIRRSQGKSERRDNDALL